MNTATKRRYKALRSEGQRASWAMRTARTEHAWDAAEAAGLVRFRVEPDECCTLADLEGDFFKPEYVPGGERAAKAERDTWIRKIEQDGVWGIIGEYRADPDDETWEHADSVWGFVGDDWRDSGYDSDMKAGTLGALKAALRSRCQTCGQVQK